ncbi:hypothetical protein [Phascolarctobacterium succinatutens]|jgi:hypothetical protein|uniref:Bbp19-like phage domain-containing protein n=1 Tax=Phascolarctobacterium succinatutens CAG:287 TaxID=1263101 RepID=R6X246_9FIRM|nr:hypothetical protein [Phascolarctobacterium succinatutens]DAG53629.1 MAG TPA: hypothetical protein [Caudoviricetes sp.]DAO78502.1 MAG TPA: hypothetical protein [Bacteriophage sp.]CDD10346.1 putative uncharacterized protein [Phascolarctobacterium succinatutens CAG:287]DAK55893.1 MAG TPA: hypothetical protein [Caudoviricetes sp.]DAP84404.1 MAG TPA: hypothetical protein [Caudoviricetes sp.]
MSEQFKYKSNTGEDRRQALLTEYMVREQARRDKEALLDLLGSESGRWFLMRMLDVTKVNSMCFTGNSKTFYNEGRRDVGLGIIKSILALGLQGIELKQQAEMEYAEFQLKLQELAVEYVDNNKEE